MSSPLVSILLCTYNAATTIRATLQSIIDQTYSHRELLVHDDQSSDETRQIITSLWDPRIHIISSGRKLWPYGWLNFLLDHAGGDYIAIQDHDDLRHRDKLTQQIAYLEDHREMIGCGTRTLMRYEWDQKGFEYFLWAKNYYTIHPSLVFRNGDYRYPTDTVYMVDAYFQKMILCKWKNLIHTIDATFTLHRIKPSASNYSYKRFTYASATLRTVFALHVWRYAAASIGRETLRKCVYPVLQRVGRGHRIDTLERIPFQLQGYQIEKYDDLTLRQRWFVLSPLDQSLEDDTTSWDGHTE